MDDGPGARRLTPILPVQDRSSIGFHTTREDVSPALDVAANSRAQTVGMAARPRFSRAAVVAGWIVILPLAVLALLRVFAHDAVHPLILANSFTPYVYLPAYGVLPLALRVRRWTLAGVAGGLVACHLRWILPGAVLAAPLPPEVESAPHLRVMSANLLFSNPDTEGIVGEVLANDPDVLVVQELSGHWRAAFESGEVGRRLPYRVAEDRETPFGAGIFSRYPLEKAEVSYAWGDPVVRATVHVGGVPVRFYDVHPLPPLVPSWVPSWEGVLRVVRSEVEREQANDGALVVAGDFNMTRYSLWFDRLKGLGLRDAHEDRGRALAVTWPNGTQLVPPITLDHVFFSRHVACLSVREGTGRGSDHRPILLDLALLR